MARAGLLCCALLGLGMLAATPAAAHPLGSATTNTAAALTVCPDVVAIAYVVDLAETPARPVIQRLDRVGDGTVSAEEGRDYRERACRALAGEERPSGTFGGLLGAPDLTLAAGLVAAALALALGGLHALAPGRGRAVLAASAVRREVGTPQILGVALTAVGVHTLGVLLFGAVLGVTEAVAPQRLSAWLGVGSGLLFATVGLTLLRTALRERLRRHGYRQLVPTPSALVVLLGGMALHSTWFGVLLVLAYGLGMGAVLVGAGWVLPHARGHLTASEGTVLPAATAGLLVVAGLALAARDAAVL